jgi:multiple sugar transport system permease protein
MVPPANTNVEELVAPRQTEEERYRRASQRAALGAAIARALMWITLVAGGILFLFPLYIMLAMSLKMAGEVANTMAWVWPKVPQWENFSKVLSNPNAPFFLFARNTLIIATLGTAGALLSASMVAYAFARLRFKGRDQLFVLVLSTMMLPGSVTMVPGYVLFKYLGWVDTFYPLIVPAFFGGGAYNIFLLRQFFMGIPRDMDEAAIIDGAGFATIFWRIMMPNAGPALATVGIFGFIYNWRDFVGPLIILNSPEKQTLELGLNTYKSLNQEQWELLMAGAVLVMIPLIVIFIAGQRYFVRGIVMTGIK